MLGFGDATVLPKSGKVIVSFDDVRAKKEFVETSIEFLGGILGRVTKEPWSSKVRYLSGGNYYKAVMEIIG